MKRIICIETVKGCEHNYCSSPCAALNINPLKMMDTQILTSLIVEIKKLRDFNICLYGLGDSSEYPFWRIDNKILTSCNTHVTQPHFGYISMIPNELNVFARIDKPLSKYNWMCLKYSNVKGVFFVVSKNNLKIFISIAKEALKKGFPVMFRSICFSQIGAPSIKKIIKDMDNYTPKIIKQVGKLPKNYCNTLIIGHGKNIFYIKKCTLHPTNREKIDSIEKIKQAIIWNPIDSLHENCKPCTKKQIDYRIYYEP